MLLKFAGAERAERREASEASFRILFNFALDTPADLQNLRSPNRRKAAEVLMDEKPMMSKQMSIQKGFKPTIGVTHWDFCSLLRRCDAGYTPILVKLCSHNSLNIISFLEIMLHIYTYSETTNQYIATGTNTWY